jgi:D-beta-D-heptose 7-phosphate kinase/D-beta-D-heptose 1-phosphate adenosyltransferase
MVLADGCFDPLHYGHIRYLSEAAAFGPLIVRIAPDSEITSKGRSPFQWRHERARMISALRMVDGVTFDDTLEIAVLRLQPSYLVKGEDWRGRLSASLNDACDQAGTEIFYVSTQERTSSERLRA